MSIRKLVKLYLMRIDRWREETFAGSNVTLSRKGKRYLIKQGIYK